ncbi:unnamed protein product, partial [Brassica oleracea var. botrytis]
IEGVAKQHQVIVTVINAGFDLCSQGVLHHHREHQLSGEINLSLRWLHVYDRHPKPRADPTVDSNGIIFTPATAVKFASSSPIINWPASNLSGLDHIFGSSLILGRYNSTLAPIPGNVVAGESRRLRNAVS